jgi:hypothetical protein
MVTLNLPPRQRGPYRWFGHGPVGDDRCACGANGDFRDHLCDLFGTPHSALFVDRNGESHLLPILGDDSGSVWVPVWLVADNPDALGWIADLGLHSADDYGCLGGRSIYRVPRWEWHPRMDG